MRRLRRVAKRVWLGLLVITIGLIVATQLVGDPVSSEDPLGIAAIVGVAAVIALPCILVLFYYLTVGLYRGAKSLGKGAGLAGAGCGVGILISGIGIVSGGPLVWLAVAGLTLLVVSAGYLLVVGLRRPARK